MKGSIGIYQLLKTSVVDTLVNGIYPHLADEGITSPYISVFQSDFRPIHSKTSSASIDNSMVTIQINSTSKRECKDIASAVRLVLDGRSATVTTADEVIYITRMYLDNIDEFVEVESSRQLYITEMIFNVREQRTPDYTA